MRRLAIVFVVVTTMHLIQTLMPVQPSEQLTMLEAYHLPIDIGD
jgi:hypothetical protein